MGRTAEVSLVLWVLCLPFASHIWVVPIWRVAIIHSPVIMHPVLCACRRPSPVCTRRSIELAHSHSFLYPLALFLLGMWEFIPSMSIEPETDKAVKDEFHYRLVLSVGCEFIAYMPFGYSSCLRYARTASGFLPVPLSNNLFRDGAKFGLQANLVTQEQYLVEES